MEVKEVKRKINIDFEKSQIVKYNYKYLVLSIYIYMATFRHSQIDEILNYDRSMNRRVLDRTVAQVFTFNEQRAPPTNRDIKFEALIAKLIDELKKNITNAIEGISFDQAQELRGDSFATVMAKRTGETGLEGPPPNPTTSFLGLEDPKLVAKKQQAAQQQAMQDAQQAQYDSGTAYGTNAGNDPMMGFGRPRKSRKYFGGGPEDVSKVQIVRKTEDQLYDIVSKYNGVVEKLIDATQPNGRFGSRNNGSNSNVQFLAGQLKEIVGPLKQLVFELSATQNFELQSQINMFDNMVKIVEQSPPFQRINISAYKSAPINYQGLNREEVIGNPKGYLATLKKFRLGVAKAAEKMDNRFGATYDALGTKILPNGIRYKENDPMVMKYFNESARLQDILARIDDDSAYLAQGIQIDKARQSELVRAVKESIEAAGKVGMPRVDGDPFAALAPPTSNAPIGPQIDIGNELNYNPARVDFSSTSPAEAPQAGPPEQTKYANQMPQSIIRGLDGRGKKSGKGKPLADYLADPIQQYNRMGRPLTSDDYAELQERANRTKFRANIPPHYTDVGLLYPFYAKSEDTKYEFATKLRKELSQTKPRRNALGADLSLLQGRIGGPTKHTPEPKKAPRRKVVTQAEATMNILEGRGRKNKKALHKLAFNDEKNDMFN